MTWLDLLLDGRDSCRWLELPSTLSSFWRSVHQKWRFFVHPIQNTMRVHFWHSLGRFWGPKSTRRNWKCNRFFYWLPLFLRTHGLKHGPGSSIIRFCHLFYKNKLLLNSYNIIRSFLPIYQRFVRHSSSLFCSWYFSGRNSAC